MCGLVGYFGAFDPGSLASGVDAISHRGPDGEGAFEDRENRVGLGHVRLAIIDPAHGAQPMYAADGQIAIVYNGEIYNFPELKRELEADGRQFRGNSDTEVILALYEIRGAEMLHALNGIFALAIWDGRDRSLLLARDAFGIKPLYYQDDQRGVVFSSEIKGLTKLVGSDGALDPQAIDRYLTFIWCPGEATPYRSVRKLEPGHAMVLRDGKIDRLWRWYKPAAFSAIDATMSEREAVEGTVLHLREAVHRQLISDVPVGAFLSGGLDSSAVVAFAREKHADLKCFTIDVEGLQEDGFVSDLDYARRVAAHLKVDLDVVRVDAGNMAGDLAAMVEQLDEPLADPAALNVLYISQLARRKNIKVLLSGLAGDDIFTGYRRHRALNLDRSLLAVPRVGRVMMENATRLLNQRRPLFRRIAKFFSGAALSGDDRLVNYFRWAQPAQLQSLYSPEFRAALGEADAAKPLYDYLEEIDPGNTPMQRMLALEQRFFLADHNLIYTDKMSMAAGVEVRVPFLDLDLVDFAARIPDRFKQRGREGKWVLKKAMEPYLPADIIYRPKSGFGAPVRRWMRNELRPLLGDMLSADRLKQRGIFSPLKVQELVSANDSGRVDASYTLLSILCVELWCRAFLDAPSLRRAEQVSVA